MGQFHPIYWIFRWQIITSGVVVGVCLLVIGYPLYLCIRACIDHKKKKDYQDANVGERKSTIYKRLKEDAKKAANVVGRALKITKKPKAVIEDDDEESQEDESFTMNDVLDERISRTPLFQNICCCILLVTVRQFFKTVIHLSSNIGIESNLLSIHFFNERKTKVLFCLVTSIIGIATCIKIERA